MRRRTPSSQQLTTPGRHLQCHSKPRAADQHQQLSKRAQQGIVLSHSREPLTFHFRSQHEIVIFEYFSELKKMASFVKCVMRDDNFVFEINLDTLREWLLHFVRGIS